MPLVSRGTFPAFNTLENLPQDDEANLVNLFCFTQYFTFQFFQDIKKLNKVVKQMAEELKSQQERLTILEQDKN